MLQQQLNDMAERIANGVSDHHGHGHPPVFTGGQITLYIASAIFFGLGNAEDAKVYVQICYYVLATISISCGLAWAMWNNRQSTVEIIKYLRKQLNKLRGRA